MPTNTISPQKILTAQNYWRSNPVACYAQFFPGRLWKKQEEVLNALRDYPRVAAKSGNAVGKSRIAAAAALIFLMSHYPSKVIITAPSWIQVEEILWREIATLYHASKIPIGGQLLQTELKFNPEWFALGISTNEVNRMQGFHSPNLLVILDEALGVDPMIWEAIEGLHPSRVLAIGNPLVPEGEFFKCFQSAAWHKISVSCVDCVEWQNKNGCIPGLVTWDWIKEREREWGVKSPLFQSRVLGEFPQEGTDTLIHLDWVDICRKNVMQFQDDDLKILATDVARYGEDKTCFLTRRNHIIEEIIEKEKIPTTQTAGIIKRHYEIVGADSLVVDDSGVGGGCVDMLGEYRIGVLPFNGGCREEAIDHNHFKNLRSQFFWYTARKFEKGIYDLSRLPQNVYDKLKSQLCSIKYSIESDGRIKIESKDDMKARGLVSPDSADAFAMSEYAFWHGRQGEIREYSYR